MTICTICLWLNTFSGAAVKSDSKRGFENISLSNCRMVSGYESRDLRRDDTQEPGAKGMWKHINMSLLLLSFQGAGPWWSFWEQ